MARMSIGRGGWGVVKRADAYQPALAGVAQVVLAPFVLLTLMFTWRLVELVSMRQWVSAAVLFLWLVFWIPFFVRIMSWLFYARPLLHRHLAGSGLSAEGVTLEVVHRSRFVRGPKDHLVYEFIDKAGVARRGTEVIPSPRREAFAQGERIEVWYSPFWSKLSCPSSLCAYDRSRVERAA